MKLMTSKLLETTMFQHKKLSESILPELIKRLILCSCPDLSNIRIPGKDDVWAPGFD